MSAFDRQEGGSHYASCKIQPAEFIHANGIGFLEGCVIKRLVRWRNKDGLQDLRKAKHEIDLIIEMEGQQAPEEKSAMTDRTIRPADCEAPQAAPWQQQQALEAERELLQWAVRHAICALEAADTARAMDYLRRAARAVAPAA